jgi:hypothetical protein
LRPLRAWRTSPWSFASSSLQLGLQRFDAKYAKHVYHLSPAEVSLGFDDESNRVDFLEFRTLGDGRTRYVEGLRVFFLDLECLLTHRLASAVKVLIHAKGPTQLTWMSAIRDRQWEAKVTLPSV